MKNFSRSYHGIIIWIILILFLSTGILCSGQSVPNATGMNDPGELYTYRFPIKLNGSGYRYLTDQSNKPFFWSGEAAWSLIAQLNNQEVDYYLDDRKEKGFTVIMISLIEHKFCTNPPANIYGDQPFTDEAFVSPNEKYFEYADYVIRAAAQRNIVVLLGPLYLGYGCRDEGWCAEVKSASPDDLRFWGRYVGKRYKDFSNIVWFVGGDTDPSPVKDKVLEMVKGIREYDTIHLFTAHNQPESMAVTPWSDESWLSVNNVYSYDSIQYSHYIAAYKRNPVMPYFQIESAYENEHKSTQQQIRSQAYWAVLSGAMGHVFGNCPIWHFGSYPSWCKLADWKAELNNQGSVSMYHLQRLFLSRQWHTLIPDSEHRILISGYGNWGSTDYITAAATSDGNTLIAYLPTNRSLTVDMDKIAGRKSKCWWYNPSNGKAHLIGTFKNSGTRSFIPGSEEDWVLLIDNAQMNFSAPGSKIHFEE